MGTNKPASLSFFHWDEDALAELKRSHQTLRRKNRTPLGQMFEAATPASGTAAPWRARALSEPRGRAGGTGPGRQFPPRRAVRCSALTCATLRGGHQQRKQPPWVAKAGKAVSEDLLGL